MNNIDYQSYIEQILSSWAGSPKEGANTVISKYGLPQEATISRLIWYNNGPWKRTIVYRKTVPHNFPKPHVDFLEQTINYRTPINMFDDIAKYDGSVYPDRTRGEVSTKCDKEAMNFLSLNLFHEIITGKRTVEEARKFYGQTAARFMQNIPSSYTQEFLFPPQRNTKDPDVPII